MTALDWVPFAIAIVTVVGNAWVTYAAVERHEKRLDKHDDILTEHGESIAALKAIAGVVNKGD